MAGDQVGVTTSQHSWKVSLRIRCQEIFEALIRIHQPVIQIDLGVTQNDGKFRTRKCLVSQTTLIDLHFVGQKLQVSVQQSCSLEIGDQAGRFIQPFERSRLHHADRLRLQIVIAQHQFRDFIGHLGK